MSVALIFFALVVAVITTGFAMWFCGDLTFTDASE